MTPWKSSAAPTDSRRRTASIRSHRQSIIARVSLPEPNSAVEQGALAAVPGPPTPILETRNLHRLLGSGDALAHVLKGVELSIRPREYVSIVGASGSGKSTLLYLLGGLDRPSQTDESGRPFDPPSRVLIDGADTCELTDVQLATLRNARVGFVFQFHYLLKEFTAQENIALPMLKLKRLSRAEAMERAAELLRRFDLIDKARRRANRLSGGEQQRVAVARALANDPAVLLADEPTGNLDKKNGQRMAELLHEISGAGQTIVMVTHDASLAARAHRMITMVDGAIVDDRRLRGVRNPCSGASQAPLGAAQLG